MAALDFANSLASSGARTAGGQGREYRKRSGLATRADQGGLNGRPAGRTRWDKFWDDAEYSFWNPDGYTVAGAIMPAFTIPHDALAYSEKYRAEQRKVAERAGAKPDKKFKARPGLQPKDPLMKGAKGLSRGLTVLNAGMSYQSALDSGRGKLDAAAKATVTTAAGAGAGAAGVALGGFTGPFAPAVSPVLGVAFGSAASWTTGALYDAFRPVKKPIKKLEPIKWPTFGPACK